jgi:hypothetical protein
MRAHVLHGRPYSRLAEQDSGGAPSEAALTQTGESPTFYLYVMTVQHA